MRKTFLEVHVSLISILLEFDGSCAGGVIMGCSNGATLSYQLQSAISPQYQQSAQGFGSITGTVGKIQSCYKFIKSSNPVYFHASISLYSLA